MKNIRKYLYPILILIIFEAVAVTLWLTKNNLFYLFNFSYIGLSISLGMDSPIYPKIQTCPADCPAACRSVYAGLSRIDLQ